jgi:hypothetical protein
MSQSFRMGHCDHSAAFGSCCWYSLNNPLFLTLLIDYDDMNVQVPFLLFLDPLDCHSSCKLS